MARSDLLIDLVHAGSQNDQRRFRRVVEELVAEERAKHHHVLADRLLAQLGSNGSSAKAVVARTSERDTNYFVEIAPHRTLDELILPQAVTDAVGEMVEEQLRADLLRTYNLEPRHRVLLVGPPGNGKTSLAEAIASTLMLPLIVWSYPGLVDR